MHLSLALALSLQLAAAAADEDPPAAREAKAWPRFLAGAASGLLAHEASHVFFDLATGAGVGVQRVEYAGLPFPAITHDPMGPRQEYLIAQAGSSPSTPPTSGCSRATCAGRGHRSTRAGWR